MTPLSARLWDFAGIDGLVLAQSLFGPDAARLAAYQSREMEYGDVSCSLLRLCEGNFRVGVYGSAADAEGRLAAALEIQAIGHRVWVKPCRLTTISAKEDVLSAFARTAIVKAPHRLIGLLPNHAVPIRLGGHAALVWRHSIDGVPMLEIQAAPEDQDAISLAISDLVENNA